jgi:hypothetical protein
MRILPYLLPTILLSTASALPHPEADPSDPATQLAHNTKNYNICKQKNPYITDAIRQFCISPGPTVGTTAARNGVTMGGFRVNILPTNCPSNDVWVPPQYCNAQFHYICATGYKVGAATTVGRYGVNGCQNWQIDDIEAMGAETAAGAAAGAAEAAGHAAGVAR